MSHLSYPQPSVPSNAALAGVGVTLTLATAVAAVGALVVGAFSGFTSIQSAKVAILLGWVVGLVASRAGPGLRAAAVAGLLSLAGSAAASVIAVTIGIVRIAHVPLVIVLSHLGRVVSVTPHIVGWFGFVCWALSAVFGWGAARSQGRKHELKAQTARVLATSPAAGAQGHGSVSEDPQ